jgi:hypothetical protein
MIIIGIYVDNCLIIGKEESIESLINELKKPEFSLKVERNVNEYLSCCIEESKDVGKLTMIRRRDKRKKEVPYSWYANL